MRILLIMDFFIPHQVKFTTEVKYSIFEQWVCNGTELRGETNRILNIMGFMALPQNGANIFQFYCKIWTDVEGDKMESKVVTIKIYRSPSSQQQQTGFHPKILLQPKNLNIHVRDQIELKCCAEAYPSPKYQWRKNNVDLSGEVNSTLLVYSITL